MIISSLKDVLSIKRLIAAENILCLDVETQGLDMVDSEVLGLGIATIDSEWYIDFQSTNPDEVPQIWAEVIGMCYGKELIAHNVPFELWILNRELEKHCKEAFNIHNHYWWDTASMAALYDENLIGVDVHITQDSGKEVKLYALSLKALSYFFLGRNQRVWEETFEQWSADERAAYCCDDVRNTFDLYLLFSELLERYELLDYYREYMAPQAYVAYAMERNGFMVDIPALLRVQEELTERIEGFREKLSDLMPPKEVTNFSSKNYPHGKERLTEELERLRSFVPEEELEKYCLTKKGVVSLSMKSLETFAKHCPFETAILQCLQYSYEPANPGSNQELGIFLVEKGYNLPATATGQPSVTADVIEHLAEQHPEDKVLGLLLEMRKLEKLENTYVRKCLVLPWEDDRVHPQWNTTGTATGRYSCTGSKKNSQLKHKRGPALQTIPTGKDMDTEDWTFKPREWFIAPKGKVLYVGDLDQAELKMLGVESQCKELVRMLNSGRDMHQETADRIFVGGFMVADPRKAAKAINFGTMYGMGGKTLAERANVSEEDGNRMIHMFYKTFPGVADKKQEIATQVSRQGYVTSFLGRRRSPILASQPPRVDAEPGTPEYDKQKRFNELWEAMYDEALKNSGYDETTPPSMIESRAVRQAFNFIIQGSVAELIAWGLVELHRRGWKILAQVHDEIIIELDDDEELKEALTKDMQEIFNIRISGVPFSMSGHFGRSWQIGKD